MNPLKTVLVWFRNDLRVADNEALFKALKQCKSEQKVLLPMYLFNSFETTEPFPYSLSGLSSCGPRRAKFITETVVALSKSLSSKILVNVVPFDLNDNCKELQEFTMKIIEKYQVTDIYLNEEICEFEKQVEKSISKVCKEKDIKLHLTWSSTLIHKKDLPYKDIKNDFPKVYSAFKKKIEKSQTWEEDKEDIVKDCYEIVSKELDEFLINKIENNEILGDIETNGITTFLQSKLFPHKTIEEIEEETKYDNRSSFNWIGGEDKALERLNSYIDSNSFETYVDTRNGNIGSEYSTKLSPYLATGAISPRQIYHKIKENKTNDNEKSAQSMYQELLWRDFFRFLANKMGRSFFFEKQLQPNKKLDYEWIIPTNPSNDNLFQSWCQGKTGYPFVDACMRELNHTGFLNNRGRMVVASFLVKDMHLDWRLGAEYFERNLLDNDPHSNYGNWAWAAGIGCDFRPRYFNPIKQGIDHDKEAKFIKRWVREVNKVTTEKNVIHCPSKLLTDEQKENLKLPSYYCNAVVDVNLPSSFKSHKREKKENSKSNSSTTRKKRK
ncbi:hypothetical protein ABK040_001859 [Willaertia magna]